MPPSDNRILALKPYLEQVEKLCGEMTPAQLCAVITDFAREVQPAQRQPFLERLSPVEKPGDQPAGDTDPDAEIIGRILALREEMRARMDAIDNGTFSEEYGEYEPGDRYYDRYDDYYDDDPESVSEEQREDLRTLFAEADDLFVTGHLSLAVRAYSFLLDMFGLADEPGNEKDEQDEDEDVNLWLDESTVDINWRETRARYCRSVFETSAPEDTVRSMCHALDLSAPLFQSRYNPSETTHPILDDIENAQPGDMPRWPAFLAGLVEALSSDQRPRAQSLWYEALHKSSGGGALARVVRQRRAPLGYMHRLDSLVSAGAWTEVVPVAQEALGVIPAGPLRAQAASMLVAAAEKLGDPNLALEGRRECFRSSPTESPLAALLAEADRQDRREEELDGAVHFLNERKISGELMITALLMGGRLEEASRRANTGKNLGWSSAARGTALFFAALLIGLVKTDPRASTTRSLLSRYCRNAYSFDSVDASSPSRDDHVVTELVAGCKTVRLEETGKQGWWDLAEQIAGGRIDAIVSGLHRGSYNRAAEVLVALMEAHVVDGRPAKAGGLLRLYKEEKYPRHRAFRSEIDSALRKSPLLAHLRSSR